MRKTIGLAGVLGVAAMAAGCATNPYAVVPTTSGAMCLLQPFTSPDGSVTQAQIRAGAAQGFRAADTNASGNLEYSEILALNDARTQTCDQTPLTDWSGTGKVGINEYGARYITAFDMADTNKDGIATHDEILYAKPAPPKVKNDAPLKPDELTQTGGGSAATPY